MLGHIIDRSIIHFFSSAGLLLSLLIILWLLERKKIVPRLYGWWNFIVPALASVGVIAVLEFSQITEISRIKSYFDVLSWSAGLGVSVWGLYRLTPRLGEILKEIVEIEKS